jgi:hypothetical protein
MKKKKRRILISEKDNLIQMQLDFCLKTKKRGTEPWEIKKKKSAEENF